MTLAFGSLFAGIGGFDLGLERAGMKCRWQVEIDKKCQEILERHWPDILRHGDIREAKGLGSVDLICGGFPCQDLSVAGKRAGLGGERSGLFFEYVRIVREVRPAWIIVENVPGLLSSNQGEDFAIVLETLTECGYGLAWRILDSQYFGVPQRRRRVFIVGYLGDWQRAAEVLFESQGVCRDFEKGGKEGEGSAGKSKDSLRADGGGLTKAYSLWAGRTIADSNSALSNIVAAPLTTSNGHHGHSSPRGDGSDNLVISVAENQCGEIRTSKIHPPLAGSGGKPGQGNPCIAIQERAECENPKAGPGGAGYRAGIAYTIEARRRPQSVCYAMNVRRLTPTECERLQGFPDGWTLGIGDSARYRMLGNAVTVPVIQWIGEKIVRIDSLANPWTIFRYCRDRR